jgi:hypothetical protein
MSMNLQLGRVYLLISTSSACPQVGPAMILQLSNIHPMCITSPNEFHGCTPNFSQDLALSDKPSKPIPEMRAHAIGQSVADEARNDYRTASLVSLRWQEVGVVEHEVR